MHFPTQILALTAILTPALGITVSYDPGYSSSSRSLSVVSCSDGSNGLLTKGYTTQGSLPSFPRLGGASTIAGWNSPACGSCYELSYQGRTVTILAIDHAAQGFNIATEAMDQLTGGQAVKLGRIDASWKEVARSACGL